MPQRNANPSSHPRGTQQLSDSHQKVSGDSSHSSTAGGPSKPMAGASPYLTPPTAPPQAVALPVIESSQAGSHKETTHNVHLTKDSVESNGAWQARKGFDGLEKAVPVQLHPAKRTSNLNRKPGPKHEVVHLGSRAGQLNGYRQAVDSSGSKPSVFSRSQDSRSQHKRTVHAKTNEADVQRGPESDAHSPTTVPGGAVQRLSSMQALPAQAGVAESTSNGLPECPSRVANGLTTVILTGTQDLISFATQWPVPL